MYSGFLSDAYCSVSVRLLDFFLMLWEQLVVRDLRKYMEQSTQIFFEFPSEQSRELYVDGSQDLKSGPTWKLILR